MSKNNSSTSFQISILVLVWIWLTLMIFQKGLDIYEHLQMNDLLEYQAKNCEPMG